MTLRIMLVAAALAIAFLARVSSGHPGSGIVVTASGDVYFVDNSPPPPEGSGKELVWKIGADGKLTRLTGGGGHWLALDASGAFSRVDFGSWPKRGVIPNFTRTAPADSGVTLVACDGQPFTFNRDGNLYFARGNLELMRLTPKGDVSPVLRGMMDDADKRGGIKGLACGPDGAVYLSYPRTVQKVTTDGRATIVADEIKIEDCGHEVDPAMPSPYLRGLAVSENGSIYAAASNCRRVIKIAKDGKVSTILKSDPWIPTGVAVHGDNVYVLEFDDAPPTTWRPRVRKISLAGSVSVVAEISAQRG